MKRDNLVAILQRHDAARDKAKMLLVGLEDYSATQASLLCRKVIPLAVRYLRMQMEGEDNLAEKEGHALIGEAVLKALFGEDFPSWSKDLKLPDWS